MSIYRLWLAIDASLSRSWVAQRLRLCRDQPPEKGGGTLEWVVIAAIVFLLAVAVGAKITQVVNENMNKIG
ncbi:hypothetical protein DP939_43105 [Spongiactinospora rosea]|uniref:Uncharacterized protein n=1 Tax=Spongiactinospora rosea TaxID=2248750 RepID=A0A366LJD3_9ACTN|nr:hypothetical protein [Spongiactinospora rosea]RBQ13971.1 hypothetical protein DP939_43105 [Spongiactinospora rosea]